MKYEISAGEIILRIPVGNKGKFRFKNRDSHLDFGKAFSTRSENISEKAYLEWQIGYDATESDLGTGKKATKLSQYSFVGANEKTKYPYELSELLFEAIRMKLIPLDQIKSLVEEISRYRDFIDNRKIDTDRKDKTIIHGLEFEEAIIRLPTFFLLDTPDGTQIEISIQKQQYASGVQPMVYFCIPLTSFMNKSKILGKPSIPGQIGIYVIGKDNAQILYKLLDFTIIFIHQDFSESAD
jgi:hypothetical protein